MSSSAPPAGRVPAASRSSGPSGPAPRHAPALLITAPASGHGKTTVVAALARRLTRDGLTVRVFKTGPDFLDPAWHTLASGHTGHNLDLWMTGEHDIRRRLYEAALDADLIIVEGVMGLYDGEPSAAELARAFDLPVLAVIDASSMTGTFRALAHGLRTWMPGLRWAGAIANRVASPRHANLIASASQRPGMEASVDCSQGPDCYLGHIRRDAAFGLPARHLGLIAASELPDALARLDAAADALDDTVLGQLNRDSLQAWRTPFTALPVASDLHANSVRPLAGRTIAVARDSAFAFIYPAISTRPRRWAPRCASSRRWPTSRCRPAMPSGCRGATPSCTPKRCRPAVACLPPCVPMSRPTVRSGPNVAACCPSSNG